MLALAIAVPAPSFMMHLTLGAKENCQPVRTNCMGTVPEDPDSSTETSVTLLLPALHSSVADCWRLLKERSRSNSKSQRASQLHGILPRVTFTRGAPLKLNAGLVEGTPPFGSVVGVEGDNVAGGCVGESEVGVAEGVGVGVGVDVRVGALVEVDVAGSS